MLVEQICLPKEKVAQPYLQTSKIQATADVFDLDKAFLVNSSPVLSVFDQHKMIGFIHKETLLAIQNSFVTKEIATVLDNLNSGFILTDTAGKIVFTNCAYSKILGISLYHIIGHSILSIEPKAQLIDVLRNRVPMINKELYIHTLNKYVRTSIYPVFDQNKQFIGVYSIFEDISYRNKLAKELKNMRAIVTNYQEKIEEPRIALKEMIGTNPHFLKICDQAVLAARTDVPILISGESGVGKEFFLDFIWKNSLRKEAILIKVNCASIPDSLFESELFGYEKGAFTGANPNGYKGKFEQANSGTIFLDEVGELSLENQAKLLRVLQEKEIERIGGTKRLSIDVRFIFATNRKLKAEVQKGNFRLDLFYRLSVVDFELPPLRSRKDDIMPLAQHFLTQLNHQYGTQKYFSSEINTLFTQYQWPGNIRELKNAIEKAVIVNQNNCLTRANFSLIQPSNDTLCSQNEAHCFYGNPMETASQLEKEKTLKNYLKKCEKELICQTLHQTNYNKQQTIAQLKISERSFYRKVEEYGITL